MGKVFNETVGIWD